MAITKKGEEPYSPPTSGQVVGAVVKALKLDREDLKTKTAQRYFKGEKRPEESVNVILEAVATSLVSSGVVSDLQVLPILGVSLSKFLPVLLKAHTAQWDTICGQVRGHTSPVRDKKAAALPYVRLAVIDLALRTAAFARLTGVLPPGEQTPDWALRQGKGRLLHSMVRALGSKLTRERLAEQLSISNNALDNLLSGKSRPTNSRISDIAAVLAALSPGADHTGFKAKLRRHYALWDLCDLLSKYVGRKAVVELGTAFNRICSRLHAAFDTAPLLPEPVQIEANSVLIMGCFADSAPSLLTIVWEQETDPVWRADLMAASKDWALRIEHVMRELSGLEEFGEEIRDRLGISSQEFARIKPEVRRDVQGDNIRLTPDIEASTLVRVSGDAEYSARNRMIQALQLRAEGDIAGSIPHLRRAVELIPTEAEYRFFLGAALGELGHVQEGIDECWISSSLKPEWDKPRVEIGIILANAYRFVEAREHLEAQIEPLGKMTPHLSACLGYARLHCNDPEAALEAYQVVLEAEPNHADALDNAARCHFLLGDPTEGARRAKEAARLGKSSTFDDWEAGKFR